MTGRIGALLVACLALIGGCTSLQWADMAPDAIREGIRDGYLLQVGDRVGVVDGDGVEHVIRVSRVNPDSVVGRPRGQEAVEIAIDDIVALRTPRMDRARTAAAAMSGAAFGSYFLVIVLLLALA